MQRTKILIPLFCLGSLTGRCQVPGMVAKDSLVVAASDQYATPNLLEQVFLGSNYRKVWSADVTLPVFDLSTSGLRITDLGGGMQTKSLRLIDRDSVKWVLRTVDKDPTGIIPKPIKNRLTKNVVQQFISAANPYAPVVIGPIARAARVTAADPGMYWVRDDAAFGEYRKLFADKVCILERKNITPEDLHTSGTAEVLPKILADNRHKVDQQIYLRARLLDMLVGDWDRHADQWIWGERARGGDTLYEALPKDRDQAFFYSNGLLVRLVAAVKVKHFVGFTTTTKNLRKLNTKSWNMDRLFLNQLTYQDWRVAVQAFHDNLTDAVIADAVRRLPAGIYAVNGELIRKKLISRRDGMLRDVPRYYRFIASRVAIYGTDEPEIFEVSGEGNAVRVTVRSKGDDRMLYQRTFDRAETKQIEILALGGNDEIRSADFQPFRKILTIDDGAGDDRMTGANSSAIKLQVTNMTAEQCHQKLRKALKIKDEEG